MWGITAVPRDITEFFPIARGNLTKIRWGHAVNSQAKLEVAFNSNVMMLEADVVLGKLINTQGGKDKIPIMAHPPDKESDLSLADFINKVQFFNQNAKEGIIKKGIKLDFKTIEAVEGAMSILEGNYAQMKFPVWINADILRGPLNPFAKPVDPNKFFPLCKKFENVTVSVGWKTNYAQILKPKYSNKDIENMYRVIEKNAVTQPITIPVRAAIGALSIPQFEKLLQRLPNDTTLTVWTGSDHIDINKLKAFITKFGVHRISLDLPGHILNQLHLDV